MRRQRNLHIQHWDRLLACLIERAKISFHYNSQHYFHVRELMTHHFDGSMQTFSFINNPSITPDLANWANVLLSASSFDDTNLLNLPISLPTQPDIPVIIKIDELFDDRTACWTSFTREKRDNTVRIISRYHILVSISYQSKSQLLP